MRLGILGPAQGDLTALGRAAQALLDETQADKILYLGDDDGLDKVVAGWAHDLVGADPGDEGLWSRAAARCAEGTPADIDKFVSSERARLRLQVFATLPKGSRTIEILDGRVALFVFDKGVLDEEDIVAASLLVFGKSDVPLVRRVGARTFVSPGPIGSPDGGVALLDDGSGGIRVEVLRAGTTKVLLSDQIGQSSGGRMRVQRDP
jgi:hypothetical protein